MPIVEIELWLRVTIEAVVLLALLTAATAIAYHFVHQVREDREMERIRSGAPSVRS